MIENCRLPICDCRIRNKPSNGQSQSAIGQSALGNMIDWKQEITKRLTGLKLDPLREAEIVEELSQHFEDRQAELLASE